MSLFKRILYYGFGILLGSIVVSYVFDGKKTEFNYLPNARTLKNFNTKKQIYSANFTGTLRKLQKDTSFVKKFLTDANVDFSNKVKENNCTKYTLDNTIDQIKYKVVLKNCDSTLVFESIFLK